MGISLDNVIDKTRTVHLICSICTEMVENPTILTTCDHMFCCECISGWKKTCEKKSKCPECRQPFAQSDISKPSRILLNLIGDIKIYCSNKECDEICNYRDYSFHRVHCDKALIECDACTNFFVRSDVEKHKAGFPNILYFALFEFSFDQDLKNSA